MRIEPVPRAVRQLGLAHVVRPGDRRDPAQPVRAVPAQRLAQRHGRVPALGEPGDQHVPAQRPPLPPGQLPRGPQQVGGGGGLGRRVHVRVEAGPFPSPR
ncbi:hypothetical protein [Nonomuraea rubra]|uniref:hypothetical protein n=1 Tax=Nonomuraea rubra TaxID=46180 RepID=UPI0031E815B5